MILLLRSRFYKEVALLLAVTIILGTLISVGVAYATDSYFSSAVTGLMGDYGEYDFIIHIRQDLKVPARAAISELVSKRFPGATLKEGVVLAGKSNFFIGLPRQFKRRDIMESLGSYISGIPGYNGFTIIMEPRITVRGIQPGAVDFFIGKISALEGVLFAYKNESGCDILLESADRANAVEAQVKDILSQYQVIEARFPIGYKADNPVRVNSEVLRKLKKDMGVRTAVDISLGDTNKDLQHFVITLGEMRRFLLGYATEVKIHLRRHDELFPGDMVALVPDKSFADSYSEGEPLPKNAVLAKVLETSGSEASAVIYQGDSTSFFDQSSMASEVSVNAVKIIPAIAGSGAAGDTGGQNQTAAGMIGATVGKAQVRSQRRELRMAIGESIKLLAQLEKASLEAEQTASDAAALLNRYDDILSQVVKVQNVLDTTSDVVGGSVLKIEGLRNGDFREVLNQSTDMAEPIVDELKALQQNTQRLDGLYKSIYNTRLGIDAEMNRSRTADPQQYNRLQTIRQGLISLEEQARDRVNEAKDLQARVNPLGKALENWKNKASVALLDFARLDSVAQERVDMKSALNGMLGITKETLGKLQSIDIGNIKSDLGLASSRLEAIKGIDVGRITSQLEYIQNSLPSLKDEDIGRSINLIDEYMQGQVIPGERIMVLTETGVPAQFVGQVVKDATGLDRLSLLTTNAGVVEPDLRGEFFHVLKEVRGIISAIVALIFTLLVLISDHATIISALNCSERYKARKSTGIKGLAWLNSTAVYGALTGGLVAVSIALFSGAKIPYLGTASIGYIGILLGLIIARYSERFSPVDTDEVIAGQALGMCHTDIMTQIVIPSGRPGIMSLLNKRHRTL